MSAREADLERIAAAGRVLGSPLKASILYHLARRPADMTELATTLGITRPSVHRALSTLRESGLVVGHARPPHFRPIVFEVDREKVAQLLDAVAAILPTDPPAGSTSPLV